MWFRVLGPLEIEGDNGPLALRGVRPRALLTALLLQPGALVPSSRLVDALWGDRPPREPANALQQVVARVRARLGDAASCLETREGGYALVTHDHTVDAEVFESLCRRARSQVGSDPEQAGRTLDEALALWRGPAYGEFGEGFALVAAARLAELRTTALEDRAELFLRAGSPLEAVAAAQELVAAEPLRERPVELLMRALHAAGRVPEALAAYGLHRARLADDLGLDPSAGLRDLEIRILRDDVPDAPSAPPLPGGGGPSLAPLPWRPGSIIGRDPDLATLLALVGSSSVVTVVGPGGVGKTRLALEAAHQLRGAGRQVAWVDFTTVEPDRLVDLVAESAGVVMPRGHDPVRALAVSLRNASTVVFLDNAENVLDALAPLVEAVTDAAPQLRFVVTSRERLTIAAEVAQVLAPLPLPEGDDPDNPAVRLFLERAGQTLAGTDLAEVADLCRRLDGLPLAIELGAARAPTFGVRELLDQLGTGLDLLSGGRRTAAARHRTLRAVVDASYAQLDPDEATLFARLAVFPGSFRLAQARSVGADDSLAPTRVAHLLARLVEQSLVQAGGGRFWLLETLRSYALELLDPPERLSLRDRHARDVADRLAELRWHDRPPAEAECVAALAGMTSDLHLAWDHASRHDRGLAVELAAAVYDYAYQRQRLDLLDWGRQVAGWDVEHPLLAPALATAAAAAWAAGDLDDAHRLALRGMDVAMSGEGSPRARVVGQAGNLAMFAGDFDLAAERFHESAELSRTEGNPLAALMCEISVCQATVYGGRGAAAASALAQLRARAEATGSPSAAAWAHFVSGEAAAETDVPAALAAYRAAAEHARLVDNRLFLNLARSSSVALAAREGPPVEALVEFERVIAEWDALGNVAALWWVLMNHAMLISRLGREHEAALLIGSVLANGDRRYMLLGDEGRLSDTLDRLRDRLASPATETALAEGATLPIDEALALARQVGHDLGQQLDRGR
ncbi:AfsR/SARP family transcriptional regulator [Nocardioides taihuensis]|uniref:BTAD domain-containing putative transcriptional regulator n=1 Tax=Nocardioides taihuensis TaxID=1835606 RepID=A0ABW0BP40_9ACTN